MAGLYLHFADVCLFLEQDFQTVVGVAFVRAVLPEHTLMADAEPTGLAVHGHLLLVLGAHPGGGESGFQCHDLSI